MIIKFCFECIVKYVFEYVYFNNCKIVIVVYKVNIMKFVDGFFLEFCCEVVKNYLGIKYNEVIVDNCCM